MTSPTRTTGKRTDSEVVQSSLSPTRRVDRNPFQTRTYQLYLAEIGERVIRRCYSVTHRGKSSEDKFKKRAPWLVEEIAIVDTKNDKVYSSSSKSSSSCQIFTSMTDESPYPRKPNHALLNRLDLIPTNNKDRNLEVFVCLQFPIFPMSSVKCIWLTHILLTTV
jgi:hypothetical protein